jgi:hypothetical protein
MEFHLIPKYRAVSVIEALKIKEVRHLIKAGVEVFQLVPEDERFPMFDVPDDSNSTHRVGLKPTFKPGEYWTRFDDGRVLSLPASMIESGSYQPAHEITPDMLKAMRAVVAKDLISDEEISKLNQMVMSELIDENQGVIGGPDVIQMQHPARLAEAVTEMVLNKLAAMA